MRWYRLAIILILVSPISSAAQIDKIERLVGICTNVYNVRNDILTYIDDTAPKFSIAWNALIKIAYNQNFIYYRAKTYKEASPAIQENSIAMRCLSREYRNGEDYKIFKHIENMMADTEERRQHIFEVSNNLFGRQGIKYANISKSELDSKCESGEYA